MEPSALPPDRSQLYELCGQFEQLLLGSLLPESLFRGSRADGVNDPSEAAIDSGQTAAIFRQAFSAAIERAGGLGLAREMFRALAQDRA